MELHKNVAVWAALQKHVHSKYLYITVANILKSLRDLNMMVQNHTYQALDNE